MQTVFDGLTPSDTRMGGNGAGPHSSKQSTPPSPDEEASQVRPDLLCRDCRIRPHTVKSSARCQSCQDAVEAELEEQGFMR